jgi:hypothetical protein
MPTWSLFFQILFWILLFNLCLSFWLFAVHSGLKWMHWNLTRVSVGLERPWTPWNSPVSLHWGFKTDSPILVFSLFLFPGTIVYPEWHPWVSKVECRGWSIQLLALWCWVVRSLGDPHSSVSRLVHKPYLLPFNWTRSLTPGTSLVFIPSRVRSTWQWARRKSFWLPMQQEGMRTGFLLLGNTPLSGSAHCLTETFDHETCEGSLVWWTCYWLPQGKTGIQLS